MHFGSPRADPSSNGVHSVVLVHASLRLSCGAHTSAKWLSWEHPRALSLVNDRNPPDGAEFVSGCVCTPARHPSLLKAGRLKP